MDPSYDPLKEFNPFFAKIDFLMNNFEEVMLSLKDKRASLEEIHGKQAERRVQHDPTPKEATFLQQMRRRPPGPTPLLPHRTNGLEEDRPVDSPSTNRPFFKRVREEIDSEEESSSESDEILKRK